MLLQLQDAFLGDRHALLAFMRERLGDHGHRQDAEFARDFGDHRRSASAGTTAHAGGDEQQIGAFKHFADAVAIFLGGFTTDARVRAGTETARHFRADLQLQGRTALFQVIAIGVGDDEFDTLDARGRHLVDRVAAAAANADHADHRARRDAIDQFVQLV